MEAERVANAKQQRYFLMIIVMYLQEVSAPKAHFHCNLKNMLSHIWQHPGVAYALQEPSRMELERPQEQILAPLGR